MEVEATTGTFATGDTNAAAADEEGASERARATRERQGAKEGSSSTARR